jgi:hypothetical protein
LTSWSLFASAVASRSEIQRTSVPAFTGRTPPEKVTTSIEAFTISVVSRIPWVRSTEADEAAETPISVHRLPRLSAMAVL